MMPFSRSWWDWWMFDAYSATPEGLGLYRISYALFVLLFFLPGHAEFASFSFVSSLPDLFFHPPPGPMQLVPGFPSPVFVEVLHFLLIVSLTAVLVGFYTRTASVATTLLFLVGYGFSYSVGKINHNMLFILLPAGMALSNWGAAYSFDARASRASRRVSAWPIALVVLATGFAMFTAGLPKILGGWLDPTTQATQGRLVRQFFVHGRQDLLAPLAVALDTLALWEPADVATVVFEVGFLAAILHPFTTRLFAAGAILFHTGVLLVLNISFSFNFIVYAAVMPWPQIAAKGQWLSSLAPRLRLPAWGRGSLVLAVAGLLYTAGSPALWLNDLGAFASGLTVTDLIVFGLAWIGLLTSALVCWGQHAHPSPPVRTGPVRNEPL